MIVVELDIMCWAFSLGGEHYNGKVKWRTKNKVDGRNYHYHELRHELTTSQARSLNKKDCITRGYAMYKKGMETNRYWDEESLIKDAVDFVKRKKFDLLVRCGNHLNPGIVLYCNNEWLKEKLTPLGERYEQMHEEYKDPWKENTLEYNEICDQWKSTIENYEGE